MKKILGSLLLIFLLNQTLYATEKIEVFNVLNAPIEFSGYLLKDNNIYIDLGYAQEERSKIFKFENKKFQEIVMTQEQVIDFADKYEVVRIDDPDIKRKDLGNNKYLILKRDGDSYTDYFMTIEEDGKERDISKNRYVLFAFGSYAYIDKKHQKIYMVCKDEKKKKQGLYIYDISNDTFIEKYVNKESEYYNSVRYSKPIRIPNTYYLMYFGFKDERNWAVYIEEIPEWKEEIEAQNKDKKEEVKQESSTEVKEIGRASCRERVSS
jgi:hypothetical protein